MLRKINDVKENFMNVWVITNKYKNRTNKLYSCMFIVIQSFYKLVHFSDFFIVFYFHCRWYINIYNAMSCLSIFE